MVEFESIKKERYPIEDVIHTDKDVKINIKNNSIILSHLKYDKNISFKGNLELLSGREYQEKSELLKNPGRYPVPPAYYFSPGTIFLSEDEQQLILDWNGIMRMDDSK